MKATLDYKGFYARFRTLKIYIDEGIFVASNKVRIRSKYLITKNIYGKWMVLV